MAFLATAVSATIRSSLAACEMEISMRKTLRTKQNLMIIFKKNEDLFLNFKNFLELLKKKLIKLFQKGTSLSVGHLAKNDLGKFGRQPKSQRQPRFCQRKMS